MPVMLRVNKKFRKIAEKILNLKGKMFDKRKKSIKDTDSEEEDANKDKDTSVKESQEDS
jgi:DNA-binding ferritin-like protein